MGLVKDAVSQVPDTLLDWAACIFFMWLVSWSPDWRAAAALAVAGLVAIFVRAGIRAAFAPQ